MSDRKDYVMQKFKESYSAFNTLYSEMLDSNNYYSSQQWTDKDASNSRKKNIKPSVYNFVKKNVDVLIGIQRQSRSALKVLPEETGDNGSAGIANILLHHAMRKGNGYMASSQGMKDQLIGGLGWLAPFIDFSRDPKNGDLRVVCESPFDIWIDPGTKEMDLSDCNYLIKRKPVHKNVAKLAYPKYADKIEDSKADYKVDFYVLEDSNLKDKCIIYELWERKIEPFYNVLVDGKEIELTEKAYNEGADMIEYARANDPNFAEMRFSRATMKLTILVNDIVVYDGDSFYKGLFYPFIPIWGFYNRSAENWSLKVEGIIKTLKDSQMEYNKTRSSITHHMLSSIHSGWIMDKNAVDDIRVLTKGMSSPVIQRNPGKSLERINTPSLPEVMINYSSGALMNIQTIGLNAESLGFQSGVESVKGMKMKMMQGLATVGEITDNFNYAFINLGKIALSMVYQFYGIDKIKRILGSEYEYVTEADMLSLKDMEHDIEIDDTTYSPVQKMYRLEAKMNMLQYGIPDLSVEDFIPDLDIDPATRKLMQERKEQRLQAQQAQQAQAQAVQDELIASKAITEKAKAENLAVQTQVMGTNVLKNLRELGGEPGKITEQAELQMETGGVNNGEI